MNIVTSQESFSGIIDRWLELEENGERFPVDFDTAWQLAGYATKASAKRAIEKYMEKDTDYLFNKMLKSTGGRGSEVIHLTCDALKELCMLSRSETGKSTRKYFIEAEKKWKLVQTNFPQVASEVEMMQLKIELAKLENQKVQTELSLNQFRHTVCLTCPEPIQQRILGYQTIKETEIVERIIDSATGKSSDGVGITYIAKTLGFKTTNQCWGWLESVGYGKNSGKWKDELIAQHSPKLSRDDLAFLKEAIQNKGGRQLFFCE